MNALSPRPVIPAADLAAPLLEVDGLSIAYRLDGRETPVTHGVSFRVAPGEVVALVGESGSGKTTLASAVLGLLPVNGRVLSGSIRLNGTDVAGWAPRRFEAIRGAVVSLVPQDPGSSLNPLRTVGDQIGEILAIHGTRDRRAIRARVLELLDRVGLTPAELRAGQYPHELSGGMKQRVLIAIAVALRPALIVADEPTSALDVTVQRRVLDLLDDLRRESGTAVLLVTHDLGVAADRADRIVVLQSGRVQEEGAARDVLGSPRAPYTRRLLADAPSLAAPRLRSRAPAAEDAVVVENLTVTFPMRGGAPFRAVEDASFRVPRGTTHAIVGESGSGKTTTARALVALQRATAGRIVVDGAEVGTLRGEALRGFRRGVQLVYQNPYSSLDPRQTLGEIVGEPLRNCAVPRADRARRVAAMLDRVGLGDGFAARPPRALSGGQRQRVAIARALVLEPRIVVLDEAVSALDVTVQAGILRLLDDLQRDLGLTYVFVTHDLAVVRGIADTVSVMRAGRIVEDGPVSDVLSRPTHPYTRDLVDAIPGTGLRVLAPLEAP